MLLLANWPKSGPALRGQILNVLMSREQWTKPLIDALGAGKIAFSEIDAAHRDRLRRLGVNFAPVAQRTAVVEQYRAAISMQGDAARGKVHFEKLCASCHQFGGIGHAVGPDLKALTDKSGQAMLTAILDPNAAVESKYTYYIVDTRDDRMITGLIAEETSASVRILQANGVSETVRRIDIKEMKSSRMSMMPEGMEMGMTAQDLADLIKYIQSN
jgi:putative heme-binding domain-containing protein